MLCCFRRRQQQSLTTTTATTVDTAKPLPLTSRAPQSQHAEESGRLTAFISGPLEPSPDYFSQHYQDRILDAIKRNHRFVMGPAVGLDTLALAFLLKNNVPPADITVYISEPGDLYGSVRQTRLQQFESLGGKVRVEGLTTSDRDAAMTRDSDYDILRYMSVEEQKLHYGQAYYPRVSATEKNERRRMGLPLHAHPELVGLDSPSR